jgi:hypothetical protein
MHWLKDLTNALMRLRGTHPGRVGLLLGVRLGQSMLVTALAFDPKKKG